MIATIYILTLIDIACTYVGVSVGVIQEANPVLAYLFAYSMPLTCLACALIIGLLLWFVSKHDYPWLRSALIVVLIVKIVIVVMHLVWLIGCLL